MLFLFAFVVRHALSETVNCWSVNAVNQHADVTGVQPCTTPWESPSDFCGFSPSSSSPSECNSDRGKSPPSSSKKFSVQIRRQSFPLAKHQTDYPVNISFVTEINVSMHILHNLLVVPVVVTCSAVCASQYFTHLKHPNILQQTNKQLVQNQPLVIPAHWT